MTNNAKHAYVLMRTFQTRLDEAVSLPLATFPSEKNAQKAIEDCNLQIRTAFGFGVLSQDGQDVGHFGQVLLSLGIKGIGHSIAGPLEFVEESSIIQPPRLHIPR